MAEDRIPAAAVRYTMPNYDPVTSTLHLMEVLVEEGGPEPVRQVEETGSWAMMEACGPPTNLVIAVSPYTLDYRHGSRVLDAHPEIAASVTSLHLQGRVVYALDRVVHTKTYVDTIAEACRALTNLEALRVDDAAWCAGYSLKYEGGVILPVPTLRELRINNARFDGPHDVASVAALLFPGTDELEISAETDDHAELQAGGLDALGSLRLQSLTIKRFSQSQAMMYNGGIVPSRRLIRELRLEFDAQATYAHRDAGLPKLAVDALTGLKTAAFVIQIGRCRTVDEALASWAAIIRHIFDLPRERLGALDVLFDCKGGPADRSCWLIAQLPAQWFVGLARSFKDATRIALVLQSEEGTRSSNVSWAAVHAELTGWDDYFFAGIQGFVKERLEIDAWEEYAQFLSGAQCVPSRA